MTDDWRSRNVFMRTAGNVYEGSGVKSAVAFAESSTTNSNFRYLPGTAGAAIDFGRDVAVSKIIDPLAGKAVKSVASYFMDQKFPAITFYDGEILPPTDVSVKLDPAPTNRPIPKRMLEVDTGNLVDITSWSSHTNVYCILSHAWRGQEIEYSVFQRVKEKKTKLKKLQRYRDQKIKDHSASELEKAVAEFQLNKYTYLAAPVELPPLCGISEEGHPHPWGDSDVASLITECNEEINLLQASFEPDSVPEVLEDSVLTKLLIKALGSSIAISDDTLKSHLWKGSDSFNNIVELLKDDEFVARFSQRLLDGSNSLRSENSVLDGLPRFTPEAAQKITDDPERGMDYSMDVISIMNHLSTDAVRKFLDDSLRTDIVSSGREQLIIDVGMRLKQVVARSEDSEVSSFLARLKTALEKRRSAEKIAQSLRVGYELFEKHWPRYSDKKKYKRYIWNDTCCINKSVVGEHQESLAMMGEWYSNAEFCVVHIDTTPDYTTPWDPLETWRVFRENVSFEPTPQAFHEIVNPNWSTRGWTLQELSLSRDVFFVNNIWQPLEPVQCDGFAPSTPPGRGDAQEICRYCANPRAWHEEAHPRYTEVFRTKVLNANESGLQPLTVPFERHTASFKNAVAKFSHVPPAEVCRGADPSKLPAYDILSLASTRNTTVETDHVYSLMGMTGNLKFQAFHAEGLTKALSRLLDEIVINSNDISVFNWVGEEFGSPIAGRSLYPVNHKAYEKLIPGEPDNDLSASYHSLIASPTDELPDFLGGGDVDKTAVNLFKSYKHLESIIDGAQAYIKSNSKDTIATLQKAFNVILHHIEDKPLDTLSDQKILSIGKTFRTITDHFKSLKDAVERHQALPRPSQQASSPPPAVFADPPPPPYVASPEDSSSPPPARSEIPTPAKDKSSKWSMKPPTVNFGKPTWINTDKLTLPTLPTPNLVSTPPPEWMKPKSGIFNTRKRGTASEKISAQVSGTVPSPEPSAASGTAQAPCTPVESPPITKQTRTKSSGMGDFFSSWTGSSSSDAVDVSTYLKIAVEKVLVAGASTENTSDKDVNDEALKTLVEEVRKTINTINDKQAFYRDKGSKHKVTDERDEDEPEAALARMISPNPIIINSSGIDAVVDIQRVKVDFGGEETVKQLRRQIAACKSPNDRITAECTLGTGLAVVKVRFSATAPQLAKQLDVCDVINSIQLGSRRPTVAEMKKPEDDTVEEEKPKDPGFFSMLPTSLPTPFATPEERAAAEAKKADLQKKREEEARIAEEHRLRASRVFHTLRFVQQSDLTLLAGEWVLARFSGAPGANWFLCLFELGSTHEFYGTRIPCSAIDFDNAAPDEDLREYWKEYIRAKKTGLCHLLQAMIGKKRSLMDAEEAKQAFRMQAQETKAQASAASPDLNMRRESVISIAGSIGEEKDKVSEETNLKKAFMDLGISKLEHWVHKAEVMWYEFEEDQKQRWLRDDALKNAGIPEQLHAAVLSLDENTTLPSMYHASRQIHFF